MAHAKLEQVFAVVLEAQRRAIEAIRPGAIASEVDAVARSCIADAGYGPYFTHGLGHGLGLQVHVDPYLPIVDTSGNRNGTWYVFADPSQGAAIGYDRLRGAEAPEICMKQSDKMLVGGGAMGPFAGDFETDNVAYRVRLVGAGFRADPRFAYAQVSA
jgi:hypothetical protein